MFCSNCGQKISDYARFCQSCGNQLSVKVAVTEIKSAMLPISLPVYKNISFAKAAPYVLILDQLKCGLIKIEPDVLEKDQLKTFREFARDFRLKTLDTLIVDFPGSIVFDTAIIQILHVETFYDGDFHRSMAFDRFTLITSDGKYKGAIDRDSDVSSFNLAFQILLGYRYSTHETVHSFDT